MSTLLSSLQELKQDNHMRIAEIKEVTDEDYTSDLVIKLNQVIVAVNAITSSTSLILSQEHIDNLKGCGLYQE